MWLDFFIHSINFILWSFGWSARSQSVVVLDYQTANLYWLAREVSWILYSSPASQKKYLLHCERIFPVLCIWRFNSSPFRFGQTASATVICFERQFRRAWLRTVLGTRESREKTLSRCCLSVCLLLLLLLLSPGSLWARRWASVRRRSRNEGRCGPTLGPLKTPVWNRTNKEDHHVVEPENSPNIFQSSIFFTWKHICLEIQR